MTIQQSPVTEQLAEQLVAWRRHLHANPELSFQEFATSRFIQARLTEWGIPFTLPADTSVVGVIEGNRPGPTVAVRADFDALPIDEQNDFAFRSTQAGVMHACGHDGHTANLLGLAQILSANRDFPGRVKLLFQAAEEQPPGGAIGLVKAGVLDDVDHVIGLHLMSDQPVGNAYISAGPVSANSDRFICTIHGSGGHGAMPHTTVDALLVAAETVAALQAVVSRRIAPTQAAVVTIGAFHAGAAPNVIANEATFTGTVRTFDPAVQATVMAEMERIIAGNCHAAGATYQFDYRKGYPALVNHPAESEVLAAAARAVLGAQHVHVQEPMMGGEDFAYYTQVKPGAYLWLGAGNAAKGITAAHHHPRFTVDEDALPQGLAILHGATLALLGA
jgi:amidohydrolase